MNYQDHYDEATHTFGEPPSIELEQTLRSAFSARPAQTGAMLERVQRDFVSGRLYSPWAVVKAEIKRAGERAAVVVDGSPERERAIHLAELRVRNIGHVLPSESELVEELFGKRALLEPWREDAELRERMLQLWRERRRAPDIRWR